MSGKTEKISGPNQFFFMLLNAHLEIKANGSSIGQVTDPPIPSWILAQDAVC